MSSKKIILNIALSAMFLSLALVLPFVTGQVPQIGNMLCPMHFPVLLCGMIVGPFYGCVVGLVSPLLRFALFGMPPILPIGIPMAFELATYGLVGGLLYWKLKRNMPNTYLSLLVAMLSGRVVWGIVKIILTGMSGSSFGIQVFLTEAFINAIPGIILQIVLIPILVNAIKKRTN